MKKFLITFVSAIITIGVYAQKVTFVSEEFESGVKAHLGLSETDDVMQTQTDTITAIDLSGLDIADISDVAYMPNVKWIDLGGNNIEDITPLASLEHLRFVNLRSNELESINPLVFTCTDSLHVNVADNYIKDYTYLFSVSSCQLLIEGMGAQKEDKNAPYFDVYQLYADVDSKGRSLVSYRGFTNMEGAVTLECGSLQESASMDGYTNSVILGDNLNTTTQAILSNGERGDTTWVVPPTTYQVADGGELTIDTELPETYEIGYLRALHGEATADGTTLHYVAPTPAVSDTLYLSYYEDGRIKGFTQLYVTNPNTPTEVKDIIQVSPLQITLQGRLLHIVGVKDVKTVKVYDAVGRLLAMQTPDSQQAIDVRLSTKQGVVIVEVDYGKRRVVTKVAAK